MVQGSSITQKHVDDYVSWAHRNISRGFYYWFKVVLSDDKNFNLDRPNGRSYYWYDLRKEPMLFGTRQRGGGSVMVWAFIVFHNVFSIVFLEGRQGC